MRRLYIAILFVAFLFVTPRVHAASSVYFAETGFSVDGRFLDYWQSNGGLQQFGFPISAVVSEAAEDGAPHQVQYFERNRFELHPEKARPYDVLLGRLGVASLAARGVDWRQLPAAGRRPGCQFFAETNHSLCEPFGSYWQSHGGLAIFGLPISDAHPEASPTDGQTYLVQYFERNRFEHHPGNPEPYRIQLGLLGSEIYGKRPQSAPPSIETALQRLVDLINAARRSAGLPPVSVSPSLMGVAGSYSQVEAAQGAINHTGPDGSTPGDRIAHAGYRWAAYTENLGAGYGNPDQVFGGWMNSAPHRADILNASVRELGLGHTRRGDDPSHLFDYWVMDMASRR